jgi:hypothetical protein
MGLIVATRDPAARAAAMRELLDRSVERTSDGRDAVVAARTS